MTENKRYEFDVMNGGGYVVGYSERMDDDISLMFTRLCEVPTKTQAEDVCNELKGLQKENEQLKKSNEYLQGQLEDYSSVEGDNIELREENEQLKSFKSKVFKLIDDNIEIYKDTTTNDEFLQIQLDTKLQTLYNLRKELQE